MGELSLDLKPSTTTPPTPTLSPTSSTHIPKPIGLFLNEISRISNVSEKLSKVDCYVKCLEEEMKKIDAFKRELPLCMLLLNDAIVTLKCEVMQWKPSDVEPLVFNKFKENEIDLKDKKSWMSSVQLWSSNDKLNSSPVQEIAKEEDRSESVFPRNGGGGGAFVPFKGFSGLQTRKDEKENDDGIQLESGLSLVPPGIKKPSSCLVNSKSGGGNRSISPSSTENSHSSGPIQLQTQGPRKQRRCWSPDLHRRFLNALQQLGGSQVATPKQIRELMKVEGLTNDEVKSHLQKYRLHSRRYPASANAVAGASAPPAENQKLALFGGLWAQPQDQCGTSKASVSQSESPQGPLQLMGTSGGTSTTGDDSMDEEDGKSESYNWKGHFYKPGEDAA